MNGRKIIDQDGSLLLGRGPRSRCPGQVMLEFSFAIILVVLLALGMFRVFQWTAHDMADRRRAHEDVLVYGKIDANPLIDIPSDEPTIQLQPYFYSSTDLDAAVNSNIFGD